MHTFFARFFSRNAATSSSPSAAALIARTAALVTASPPLYWTPVSRSSKSPKTSSSLPEAAGRASLRRWAASQDPARSRCVRVRCVVCVWCVAFVQGVETINTFQSNTRPHPCNPWQCINVTNVAGQTCHCTESHAAVLHPAVLYARVEATGHTPSTHHQATTSTYASHNALNKHLPVTKRSRRACRVSASSHACTTSRANGTTLVSSSLMSS